MIERPFMKKNNALAMIRQRMRQADIREEDIREDFIHSPGKGGQNVNKVATCVCLFHVPSGLRVKCHQERAQRLNRVLAREMLLERMLRRRRQIQRLKAARAARRRRQQRRRPARVKEAILKAKRYRAQKKDSRRKIHPRQID